MYGDGEGVQPVVRTRSLIGRGVACLPWARLWTRPNWLAGRTDALGRDGSAPYLSLGVGGPFLSGASLVGRDEGWADVRWWGGT